MWATNKRNRKYCACVTTGHRCFCRNSQNYQHLHRKPFNKCLNESKRVQYSLIQKERSVPDFTISLVGRTKSGKSTLHSILTNHGRDKIGTGAQRTTRYNRVYQWNLLKLIDTPGIGSAEANGRNDDAIAESVLGESDVICLVVRDDSVLQDVLEFIEKIASLNKPIIVLLNHMENITSPHQN